MKNGKFKNLTSELQTSETGVMAYKIYLGDEYVIVVHNFMPYAVEVNPIGEQIVDEINTSHLKLKIEDGKLSIAACISFTASISTVLALGNSVTLRLVLQPISKDALSTVIPVIAFSFVETDFIVLLFLVFIYKWFPWLSWPSSATVLPYPSVMMGSVEGIFLPSCK